ncbi:MAG: ubiquitin-like protein Pup [Dietzia sp.]
MSQIQKNAGGAGESDDEAGQVAKPAQTSSADSLLDEIDDILETNAEEFVKSYVQKGGQ